MGMTQHPRRQVPEGQVLGGREVAEHATGLDQAAVIRLPAVGEQLQVLDLKRSAGVFDRDLRKLLLRPPPIVGGDGRGPG